MVIYPGITLISEININNKIWQLKIHSADIADPWSKLFQNLHNKTALILPSGVSCHIIYVSRN